MFDGRDDRNTTETACDRSAGDEWLVTKEHTVSYIAPIGAVSNILNQRQLLIITVTLITI